ncbi:G-type lectin S-receptor-like serine/threonine-protein kinase SD1-1 [Citrus sinensis]|nr:G-type lectin S-receptor-like serine/threonine-protein kinase SD1-1 [Citrus sinensis]
MVLITGCLIHKSRRNIVGNNSRTDQGNEDQNEDLELPLFELAAISNATDNFSINNKLGEGGFRPVYWENLKLAKHTSGEQEISVKRLSKISEQGLKELKNEERRICLNSFIFGLDISNLTIFIWYFLDQTRRTLLDWSKHFHIICRTARVLLYLHQDFRLRITHRDLKASNVLLDNDMNPKISDFGLARPFGGDETEGSTDKSGWNIVGIYCFVIFTIQLHCGYMAPKYASDELFSVESDVSNFGILLLEIVRPQLNLIGHAWKLWKEDMPSRLIYACCQETCNLAEVMRCIDSIPRIGHVRPQ